MARLTAEGRSKIPAGDFTFPAKRAYPVDNPKRARTALALVGMHGTPAQKAAVRAKVHAKYPTIGE